MKKNTIILTLIITLLSVFVLSACTQESPPLPTPEEQAERGIVIRDDVGQIRDVDPKDIYSMIDEKIDLPDMYLGDDDWIMNNYGLDPSRLNGYVCAEADEVHADRVFIIRVSDDAYIDEVSEKLNNVLSQLQSPEMLDYLPDQAPMIKAASVQKYGNYVYLFISPDAEEMESVLKSALIGY